MAETGITIRFSAAASEHLKSKLSRAGGKKVACEDCCVNPPTFGLVSEGIARWCSDCSKSHDQVEAVVDPKDYPKTQKENKEMDSNVAYEVVTAAAALINRNNPMLAVRAIRPRCHPLVSVLGTAIRFTGLLPPVLSNKASSLTVMRVYRSIKSPSAMPRRWQLS